MPTTLYAIAIGSNKRGRHGGPAGEVMASIAALQSVRAVSRVRVTAPLGPSIRRFVNVAVLVETGEPPPALLTRLKRIEREFGRRRGRRWAARVIDLDIILWSGGCWASPGLIVPHIAFRQRRFVLDCLADIVPQWRDPVTRLTIRQLKRRLTARARVRNARCLVGPVAQLVEQRTFNL